MTDLYHQLGQELPPRQKTLSLCMLKSSTNFSPGKKSQPPSLGSLQNPVRTRAGARALSSTQMSLGLQILPYLSLILLVWNQVPGLQAQEFRFGPCQVSGVVLPELWEAFWTVKNAVQTQDNITSIRLLKPQVLQNVSDAETCYLAHSLLKFYLNTVFKHYHSKIAKSKVLKSFSTLANNFMVIASKLQPSKDDAMFPVCESAQRRFLLFRRAFKQLDIEVALVKAFGEVDILLTWMQKFYRL